MQDRHAARYQTLVQTVLSGPGTLDSEVRQAAASGTGVPPALQPLVDKIHRHAYQVTDQDLQSALQAGYTQDQLFELVVSTALGAAKLRRDGALAALRID